MTSHESGRIALSLAARAEAGADAAQIADEVISAWKAIDAALSPIIGHASVAVLYMRSVCLLVQPHPWLASACEGERIEMHLPELRSALVQQAPAAAAAAAGKLLRTFHELLASLLGPSLTEQLLRSVWAHSSSGQPAQDPT